MPITGQKRKVQITVNYSGMIDETLSNFTLTLAWYGLGTAGYRVGSVPEEMITLDGAYACRTDGGDVRATTDEAGLNECPIDITAIALNANWRYSIFEAHIKVPTLSHTQNTTFWLWYNDPTATGYAATATYGRNNVWSSYDKGVFHLAESSGSAIDSIGSGYDGTYAGSSFPNRESGSHLYGYYQNFVAANSNYVEIADTPSIDRFDIVGDVSMMAVAHPGSAWNNASQFLMGRGQDWCRIRREASTAYVGFSRVSGGNTYTDYSTADVLDHYFHHLHYNFKRSTGAAGLYVDGVLGTLDTHASDTDTSGNKMRIGLNVDITARKWDGLIKEVRFSTTARTAAWIKAEFYDTINPEYLMTVGTPQDVPTGGNWFLLNNRNDLYNTMQLTNGMR